MIDNMNNDIHAQTARELFGEDGPAFRLLAKRINFGRMYGGTGRLMPHQQELVKQAEGMTRKAWPGLNLDCGKTGALHIEPDSLFYDETSIIIERRQQ